ncbi:hypothetical protein JIN85_18780 [Luteolibacter pohnpeiensis]|uniref:Uncharacterized protein n=1 Tax=Luteolibacter pohnpeiensis TaxID=454153 RepID=A0A934SEL4_9BACT|nr:DUF5362 family protein [Luteolibacter pohnpeiensis]MBK1884469.1 hypothetical protein [Luteolibacter pohnpeiensis]
MQTNPYSAPIAEDTPPSMGGPVNYGVVEQLVLTRPWVRLISLIAILFHALMLFVGSVWLIISSNSGPSYTAGSSYQSVPKLSIMGISYLIFGILGLYPALKLWKYASRISRLYDSSTEVELIAALTEQKKFWRFTGILILMYIAAIAMMVIINMARN